MESTHCVERRRADHRCPDPQGTEVFCVRVSIKEGFNQVVVVFSLDDCAMPLADCRQSLLEESRGADVPQMPE